MEQEKKKRGGKRRRLTEVPSNARPYPRAGSGIGHRGAFTRRNADFGIGDLYVQRHVRGPSKTPDMHSVFGADVPIPALDPGFHLLQLAFDTRGIEIIPDPPRQESQGPVQPVSDAKRVKGLDQALVDGRNHAAKLLLRQQGVQDLRIEVGQGGRQVPLDHPVPADANDTGGEIFLRADRDVGVEVRIAWVRRAPCQFVGDVGRRLACDGGHRGDLGLGTKRGLRGGVAGRSIFLPATMAILPEMHLLRWAQILYLSGGAPCKGHVGREKGIVTLDPRG